MKNLPGLIIPFKRPVYERVVKEFSALAPVGAMHRRNDDERPR